MDNLWDRTVSLWNSYIVESSKAQVHGEESLVDEEKNLASKAQKAVHEFHKVLSQISFMTTHGI